LHEGFRRGAVDRLEQRNTVEGKHCLRSYIDSSGAVVAQMYVFLSNTSKPAYECEREFKIDKALIDATSTIYVASQEQMDEWDNAGLDIGLELIKIDPRYSL